MTAVHLNLIFFLSVTRLAQILDFKDDKSFSSQISETALHCFSDLNLLTDNDKSGLSRADSHFLLMTSPACRVLWRCVSNLQLVDFIQCRFLFNLQTVVQVSKDRLHSNVKNVC